MTAIDRTPDNLNLLSQLNFRFLLKRAPHVEFFIQKVNIPSISLKEVEVPNQFVKVPYPGDHIDYSNLDVTFKVDEDLNNYLEIHNWIRALGKPTEFTEYKEIAKNASYTGMGVVSDIAITVMSNIKNYNYEINFIDAFPVNLSGIEFRTTDSDIKYIEATATFKYSYYNLVNV